MNKSTCSFCGHQWLTGQDGDHSCSQYLLKQLTAERARVSELSCKVVAFEIRAQQEEGRLATDLIYARIQRDQLASHLSFAVNIITLAGLGGNAQVNAMRSALSDICAAPPGIAPSSEHSAKPDAWLPVDRKTGERWMPTREKGNGLICDYFPLYIGPLLTDDAPTEPS